MFVKDVWTGNIFCHRDHTLRHPSSCVWGWDPEYNVSSVVGQPPEPTEPCFVRSGPEDREKEQLHCFILWRSQREVKFWNSLISMLREWQNILIIAVAVLLLLLRADSIIGLFLYLLCMRVPREQWSRLVTTMVWNQISTSSGQSQTRTFFPLGNSSSIVGLQLLKPPFWLRSMKN